MKFINIFPVLIISILLTSCGGSDDDIENYESPSAEISLSPDAPNNDLHPENGFISSEGTQTAEFCSRKIGGYTLTGVVTSVQDGDTITINGEKIRLDSIDAPEMSQTFGKQSKQVLESKILNKTVIVTYAKIDKYNRIVGNVFTPDCNLINLEQVKNGSAWYYKAYQCEIDFDLRNEYEDAQARAQNLNLGLWAYNATPPWVYRNGTEPKIPNCSSKNPTWDYSSGNVTDLTPPPVTPSKPPSGTSQPGTSTPPIFTLPGSCTPIWVRPYTRADGTRVRGHYRRPPGCA